MTRCRPWGAALLAVAAVLLAACSGTIDIRGSDGGQDGPGDAAPPGDGAVPADGPQGDGPAPADGPGQMDGAPTGAWSLGYYASWHPEQYPVAEIEWAGLTHIAMAFYTPQADGSLTLMGGDPQVAQAVVTAAHANGVKAIASIGGADSGTSFRQATASGTISAFVVNLVGLMDTPGYDGIDIDWEPLETTDEPVAIDVANRVRAARPGAIMTVAIGYVNPNVSTDVSGYPGIAAVYDQLNIMSYGMAGAWQGWNSWHDSPLYQTDPATPLSIDSTVGIYAAAGVPKAKLGVGIGFFGLCYSAPVTGPDQPLNGATILASDGTMSYTNIMGLYYDASARQWDSLARVPYLSFASAHAPDGCTYISYDDEQSIGEKGTYVKAQGLGGVMQWEINEGYLPSAPAGQRSPLLSAIADHVLH